MIRVVSVSVKACLEVCCRLLFLIFLLAIYPALFGAPIIALIIITNHLSSYIRSSRTFTIYPAQGGPKHVDTDAGTQHEFPYVMASGKQWRANVKFLSR